MQDDNLIIMTKICSKCQIEKDFSEFYRSKTARDGLHAWCKKCGKEYDNSPSRKAYFAEYAKEYEKSEAGITRRKKSDNKRAGTEKRRKSRNMRKRLRRSTDVLYRMTENLRSRTRNALYDKNITRKSSVLKYLGCSAADLKIFLEQRFEDGMSWDNYGFGIDKWNIDHIVPLSIAKTEEELVRLCHYSNLQPMWQLLNIAKSDKIRSL